MPTATIDAPRREAARPEADERLRRDRDHLAGHHDAAARDRARAPTASACAVPCAEILVMDDDGREVPPARTARSGSAGRWSCRATGTTRRPRRESFVGGFWRSGDIGSMDAEGYVRVLDRKKDMINRGGYKIYTVEVENVLAESPGVLEARGGGEPCPVLGERVHAFVVARDGAASRPRRCAPSAPSAWPTTRCRRPSRFAPSRCRATPTARS